MKILIIKLGAKGDVVRTLPILPALNKKYPKSEITWITKDNISDIFEGNPNVKKVLTIPCKLEEEFDILYNFDVEDSATALAKEIKAKKKYGFSSQDSFPSTFNLKAEYYLNTMFDDELKKSNRKTYQEMMFEAAELNYNKELPELYINEKDKAYASDFILKNKINKSKLIGIHMGAGPRWPSKAWDESKVKEFIKKASAKGYEILLFGGPDESDKHTKLVSELKKEGITVYQNNPNNSNREFISLMSICNKIICSDSFAIHISIALKKQTIGLFFCTSPYEVEGYNLLQKVTSPMLYGFFPERMNEYSKELVNSIKVEDVLKFL